MSEPTGERVLKPEYQEVADEFNDIYWEFNCCSCHLYPPCGWCVHPGNPRNLEDIDEAWESDAEPTT